jgi:hypothetical protein
MIRKEIPNCAYGRICRFQIDGSNPTLYIKTQKCLSHDECVELLERVQIYDESSVLVAELDGIMNNFFMNQNQVYRNHENGFTIIPLMFPKYHYKGTVEIEFPLKEGRIYAEYSYENNDYPLPVPRKVVNITADNYYVRTSASFDIYNVGGLQKSGGKTDSSPTLRIPFDGYPQTSDYIVVYSEKEINKIHIHDDNSIPALTINYKTSNSFLCRNYADIIPMKNYYIVPLKISKQDMLYLTIEYDEKETGDILNIYYF